MMKFFNKLTVAGRIAVALIATAIVCGIGFGLTKTGVVNPENLSITTGGSDKDAKKYDAVLLVDTYTGWAPIVWGNGGKEGSEDSYFYKKFGIKLLIKQMDDFDGATSYWKETENALRFCTLDSYPVEAGQGSTMEDARYFVIHNFSAGADAIVATANIKTVADLKGKKIACSEGTASHSLLLNTLETAGLTGSDVEIVTTSYGSGVADAFKAKAVDAAVVFCPDDDACIKAVPGTHILTSTKQANTLVTDGFLAHSKWLAKYQNTSKKIAEALLWANSEMTNNPETYKEVCKVFSESFDVPLEDVLTVGEKINFATLEDNVNWFGLSSKYTGVTGENLYTKMTHIYGTLGLTKATLPWRKISDISVVETLAETSDLTNEQGANGTKVRTFSAPSPEVQNAVALSNKKVVINFPTDGYSLNPDAETIIEREFLSVIKSFNQVYVRIEGNTDNTGNYKYNVNLSQKRAQAVADYLVRMGMDKNRFIVKGNGPDHAIKDGVKGSSQDYRTTDLMLIAE